MTDFAPVFGARDPDARGYYGPYGGRFVPETLVAPVEELTAAYSASGRTRASVRNWRNCCAIMSDGPRRSTKRGR